MKQDNNGQNAANRARIRRMRTQYNKALAAAIVICFLLGIVVGAFAYRWYAAHRPKSAPAQDVTALASPEPGAPEDEDEEAGVDDTAVQDAFPEVDNGDEEAFFTETEETLTSDAVEEFDPTQAEIPEEYLTLEDENGEAEASELPEEGEEEALDEIEKSEAEDNGAVAEEPSDEESAVEEPETEETEAEAEEPATEETEAGAEEPAAGETEAEAGEPADNEAADEAPADAEAEAGSEGAVSEETEAEAARAAALAAAGPQVIAIVPFGESFTYSTQIDANGNARVDAGDAPYETVSFTQTMKNYMRPTDFADLYSKTYKLAGDEAGAGFELVLNNYTGEATIIPQNVIDIGLRSASGEATERGYQLMDAPIDGNYNVSLVSDTPRVLYKRFPYSSNREDMFYLVVTTYNDGVSQMILFELESDEPEPEPTNVYTVLQRGIVSDEVANMQARLIELGHLKGVADGSFGGMTEEAIKKAQEAFGMEATGIADSTFQERLFEGAEPTPTPGIYATLREGNKGEAVVNLQLRMRELGYYNGRADGGYGPMTVSAVKKTQAAFGMEQTGVADSAFQEKLYEGMEPTPAPEAEATPAPEGAGTPEIEATPTPEPTQTNEGGETTVG